MNKENIESPNQNIPVNCLHAVCPNCGKDVDVIPAKGTVIESPNVQEGKPVPKWYDYNSLLGYLQGKKWSFKAASEIAQDYADNLQQAFAKGWEKAFNDYKKSGTLDYVYYPKQLAEIQEKNALQYVRGEKETLEQWKIRLNAVLQTEDYKKAYEAIEKQEPSCYADIALLMFEWQSQHSYTEAEVLAMFEQVKEKVTEAFMSDKSITDIDFKYLLK